MSSVDPGKNCTVCLPVEQKGADLTVGFWVIETSWSIMFPVAKTPVDAYQAVRCLSESFRVPQKTWCFGCSMVHVMKFGMIFQPWYFLMLSVLVKFCNFLFLAWFGFNGDTPCVVVFRGHSKFGQLKAEGNAGKHTMRHIVRTGSCRESIARTELSNQPMQTEVVESKKSQENYEQWWVLHHSHFVGSDWVGNHYNGGDQGMVAFESGDVLTIFWHIPGSSKYVEFVPFGRFLRVKRHHFLHTWKIQVCIYINICVVQLQYWRLCLSCPAINSINRCKRVSIKNPNWNSVPQVMDPHLLKCKGVFCSTFYVFLFDDT